jgi:transposase, IS5 family
MLQFQQAGRGGKNRQQRQQKAARKLTNKATELSQKVTEDIRQVEKACSEPLQLLRLEQIRYFLKMLDKHIDLLQRRVLKEETIAHEEKVFSLFEAHTQWIAKGKMRPPVELGHRVLLSTDQHSLVLDYKVMEDSTDNQETKPLVDRLIKRFGSGEIQSLSMDKGFSDMSMLPELQELIPQIVMPKKGRRNQAEQERETSKQFKKLKRRYAAVESNINSLEHHGLNRCPDKGLSGFKRYVGMGVLAYNLHRIGRALLEKQRQVVEPPPKAA